MKRNHKNDTIVDFQGRTENQVIANEQIGCFSLIIFVIIAIGIIIFESLS